MFVSKGVGKLLCLQLHDRLGENLLVSLVAQVGYKSALLGSEQVAGATYVQILHGDMDT